MKNVHPESTTTWRRRSSRRAPSRRLASAEWVCSDIMVCSVGAAGSSATEVSSEVSSPLLLGHRGMRCQARRWVLMSRPGSNVFDSCDRRCSLARARLLGLPLRLALAWARERAARCFARSFLTSSCSAVSIRFLMMRRQYTRPPARGRAWARDQSRLRFYLYPIRTAYAGFLAAVPSVVVGRP